MFKIQFEIKSKMTAYVWAISGYEPNRACTIFRISSQNVRKRVCPIEHLAGAEVYIARFVEERIAAAKRSEEENAAKRATEET